MTIEWHEGDAEALPFDAGAFDVVLSQFGHMFAPRPDVALAEMLRVLRPGGRIAFATWPPELFTAGMFALVASHLPPPAGAASPALWGDPGVVRARLGERCADLHFDRGILRFATLSPQHYRAMAELTVGPVRTLVQAADANERQRFRSALEELAARYLQDNEVLAGYLLTRARLRS